MKDLVYQKLENKNINLGIEILRMILSFWVLSFHCLENNKINYFLYLITKTKFYHVPCFSFISFYFSNNVFYSGDINKFKKRLERLLIPYIIWPFIFFISNNAFTHKKKISFYELYLQIICGRQFSIPLWYLFSIIFLTILIYILLKIFKDFFLFIIQIIIILIYMIQYSHLYNLLDGYKDNVRLPILGTLNIFPLSALGLIFSSSQIFQILQIYRKNVLFFSYIFLFCSFRYNIFIDLGGFQGISYIFSSLSLFVGFYLLPFDSLNPFLKKSIKQITSYTNGIYCLHTRINGFLKDRFGLEGTLKNIFIIYIVTYFISLIGTKIFGKYKLKYLFI